MVIVRYQDLANLSFTLLMSPLHELDKGQIYNFGPSNNFNSKSTKHHLNNALEFFLCLVRNFFLSFFFFSSFSDFLFFLLFRKFFSFENISDKNTFFFRHIIYGKEWCSPHTSTPPHTCSLTSQHSFIENSLPSLDNKVKIIYTKLRNSV